MENTEEIKYEVIITHQAEVCFYEILDYLYDNYSFENAERIAGELRDTAKKLEYYPDRGAKESRLAQRSRGYRYILFARTSRTEIKVIYYIDHTSSKVYITDFFPTEKDSDKLPKRN